MTQRERLTKAVKAVCPMCGSDSFRLFERLEVSHVFSVVDGNPLPMRRLEAFPEQIGFSANCDCGHVWVPRYKTAIAIMDAEAGLSALKDGST